MKSTSTVQKHFDAATRYPTAWWPVTTWWRSPNAWTIWDRENWPSWCHLLYLMYVNLKIKPKSQNPRIKNILYIRSIDAAYNLVSLQFRRIERVCLFFTCSNIQCRNIQRRNKMEFEIRLTKVDQRWEILASCEMRAVVKSRDYLGILFLFPNHYSNSRKSSPTRDTQERMRV